jgi:hypothetical protein
MNALLHHPQARGLRRFDARRIMSDGLPAEGARPEAARHGAVK